MSPRQHPVLHRLLTRKAKRCRSRGRFLTSSAHFLLGRWTVNGQPLRESTTDSLKSCQMTRQPRRFPFNGVMSSLFPRPRFAPERTRPSSPSLTHPELHQCPVPRYATAERAERARQRGGEAVRPRTVNRVPAPPAPSLSVERRWSLPP